MEIVAKGVRRITAPNPGPMTFTGTQTYILGEGAVAVIDPGPDDPRHLAAIESALTPGERISHVLVTHAHIDHTPLAARLGVPVHAFGDAQAGRSAIMRQLAQTDALGGGEGVDPHFTPDVTLADGDTVAGEGWSLTALHTPGHMANHLSFVWEEGGVAFTGDHVMGWASTLVSPPDGDLTAFMSSLRRMQGGAARHRLLPGHGEVVEEGEARVADLIAHRESREAQILAGLDRPATTAELTAAIYTDVDPRLHPAAARNVLAHLIDLHQRGIVATDGPLSATASFRLR